MVSKEFELNIIRLYYNSLRRARTFDSYLERLNRYREESVIIDVEQRIDFVGGEVDVLLGGPCLMRVTYRSEPSGFLYIEEGRLADMERTVKETLQTYPKHRSHLNKIIKSLQKADLKVSCPVLGKD